jgi:gamma-glutamylcyclotransferase (GGCT)/AIG2-like uncharacterized protein YtfP
MITKMEENRTLIAVYGSLRKGLSNHPIIVSALYVGDFTSDPVFKMYDLGAYPAITHGGNSSIEFEVYAVNAKELGEVNSLEGFHEGRENNYYDRAIISESGKLSHNLDNAGLEVESGNWKDHHTTKIAN